MERKTSEHESLKIISFLLLDDFESSINNLSSIEDLQIVDIYTPLNLISFEMSRTKLETLQLQFEHQFIDNKIINKIDLVLLNNLKDEISTQNETISTLIDLEPFTEDNIRYLQDKFNVVVEKKYPYLSSIHATFSTKTLLELAKLDCVLKVSDSKGDIIPTEGGENVQY